MTQLYRHYGAEGELLYVGISLSAINRLSQHSETATWFPKIARVDIEKFADRDAALDAEIKAIREERPLFNRKHRTRAVRAKTTSAMTPAKYKAMLVELGLTPYAAGPELGISHRQSIRYAQGDADIPEVVAKLVTALVDLNSS